MRQQFDFRFCGLNYDMPIKHQKCPLVKKKFTPVADNQYSRTTPLTMPMISASEPSMGE